MHHSGTVLVRGRLVLAIVLLAVGVDVALGGVVVEQRHCADIMCKDCTSTMLEAGRCLHPKGMTSDSYTVACNASGVVFAYYEGSGTCTGSNPYVFTEPADKCMVHFGGNSAAGTRGAALGADDASTAGSTINVCHGTTTVLPTHPPHPTSKPGEYNMYACEDGECYFCMKSNTGSGKVNVCQDVGDDIYYKMQCNATTMYTHQYTDKTCTQKMFPLSWPLYTCYAGDEYIEYNTCNPG